MSIEKEVILVVKDRIMAIVAIILVYAGIERQDWDFLRVCYLALAATLVTVLLTKEGDENEF